MAVVVISGMDVVLGFGTAVGLVEPGCVFQRAGMELLENLNDIENPVAVGSAVGARSRLLAPFPIYIVLWQ